MSNVFDVKWAYDLAFTSPHDQVACVFQLARFEAEANVKRSNVGRKRKYTLARRWIKKLVVRASRSVRVVMTDDMLEYPSFDVESGGVLVFDGFSSVQRSMGLFVVYGDELRFFVMPSGDGCELGSVTLVIEVVWVLDHVPYPKCALFGNSVGMDRLVTMFNAGREHGEWLFRGGYAQHRRGIWISHRANRWTLGDVDCRSSPAVDGEDVIPQPGTVTCAMACPGVFDLIALCLREPLYCYIRLSKPKFPLPQPFDPALMIRFTLVPHWYNAHCGLAEETTFTRVASMKDLYTGDYQKILLSIDRIPMCSMTNVDTLLTLVKQHGKSGIELQAKAVWACDRTGCVTPEFTLCTFNAHIYKDESNKAGEPHSS